MSARRELETAEHGASRGTSVFRSCAEQIGLPLEVVVRAAQTGQLGRLLEARKGSGRNVEKRNLVARIDSMYRRLELAAKPPWG